MDSETAILLIAHGSREAKANAELHELGGRLEGVLGRGRVYPCFLEIEGPTIQEAFRAAMANGARRMIAFPFFLSTGVHVRKDIPEILADCLRETEGISVSITPALGPDPSLDRIVLERILSGGKAIEAMDSPKPNESSDSN